MTQRVLMFVIAAMGFGGGASIWLAHRRSATAESELRGAIAALASSVRRVEDRPAPTATILRERTTVRPADAPSDARSGSVAATRRDPREDTGAEVSAELPRILEHVYARGAPDRAAQDVEKRFRRALEQVNSPAASLSEPTCTEAVCRMAGTFASKEDFNRFMVGLFKPTDDPAGVLGEHGSAYANPLTAGADHRFYTDVYVFRAGHDFNAGEELLRMEQE